MKKILIICDLFPPAFGPRMGYLCKYLQKSAWQPFVITEQSNDKTFAHLQGYCDLTSIHYYPTKKTLTNTIIKTLKFALHIIFGYKNHIIRKEAQKLMKKHSFNAILCSSYRDFPLAAAVKISRNNKIPLVADFRDIVEQYTGYEYISQPMPAALKKIIGKIYRKRIIARRNRLLKYVHTVTTVSEQHLKTLSLYHHNVHLIYNGYDHETFYPQQIKTNTFNITYTGRIQSKDMRDPTLLFSAIATLNAQGIINPGNCRLKWYTDQSSQKTVQAQAAQAGIEQYIDLCGYIPAQNIPAVLNNSSILLILTNESESTPVNGIMTTKAFEYLATGKPILCVYSKRGPLKQLITQTRAGLASHKTKEVIDFIYDHYSEWKKNGYTSVPSNRKLINSFSREEQALQFILLFDKASSP